MFVPILASAAVAIRNVSYSSNGVTADVYTDEYNSVYQSVYLAAYADLERQSLIGSSYSPITVHESRYFSRIFLPMNTSSYSTFYLFGSYNSVLSSVYAVTGNGSGGTPGQAITGSISGSPTASLENSWLYIHLVGGSNTSYFHTQIKNGQFTFHNLPDGQYKVDGYYDSGWVKWNSIPVEQTFYVIEGQSKPSPLSINIPQNNINGQIKLGEQAITNAWLNLHSTSTSNAWFSAKISNGSFSLYLPNGSYVVDGYSDPTTYAFTPLPMKVSFSIINGQSDPETLNISIPVDNITGTIYDGDSIIKEAWLNIRSLASVPQWYNARIVNSSFHTYLPDGQYEVQGYSKGTTDSQGSFISYRMPFTVSGGKLLNSPLAIVIPAVNVTGTVTNSDVKVPIGWASIHSVGTNQSWYNAKIQNGAFQLFLPDGSYEFVGYSADGNSKFVAYTFSFTVSGGTSVPGSLNIQIPNQNVTGTLSKGNSPISQAWLSIRDVGNNSAWYSAKVQEGQFSLYLPDGSYRAVGYTDPASGEYTALGYSFTVVHGKTESAPLNIVVANNNVTGTIQVGTTPVENAWLDIQNLEDVGGRYHTKVKNGIFALYLPDGEYEVKGYSLADSQQYKAVTQAFKVKDGISNPATLQITIQQDNVSGTVQTQAEPVTNAWLIVQNGNNSTQRYTVKIENGQFHLYLSDGSYKVVGYYDEQRHTFIQFENTFTVSSGVSSPNPLTLTVPTQNVTGSITNVSSGWVSIHPVSSTDKWYTTQIQNGTFKLYLPDGQYQVNGYWDAQGKVYTQLNSSFTVSQGQTIPSVLALSVPSVTLQGSLLNTDGTPIAQAWVFVKNASTNELRSFQTQSDGSFSSRLPVGSYTVVGYSANKNWYPRYDETFTITDSNLTTPLSLQLNAYSVVFTGKVTKSGEALTKVWILLQDVSGRNYYVKTDDTGTYEARVPKGKYTLVGVYLGSGNGWYLVNQPLSAGTQTVTQNVEVKVAGQ